MSGKNQLIPLNFSNGKFQSFCFEILPCPKTRKSKLKASIWTPAIVFVNEIFPPFVFQFSQLKHQSLFEFLRGHLPPKLQPMSYKGFVILRPWVVEFFCKKNSCNVEGWSRLHTILRWIVYLVAKVHGSVIVIITIINYYYYDYY